MNQQLRCLWECYLQVPLQPASRKVKTEKLEEFLRWALHHAIHSDGNILPEFSDMHSVSNLLAGEFLVDVHQICSNSCDEDVTRLQRYLLQGRGGVILRVLQTIGVQGLSCGQELAELLVSLVPLCVKFTQPQNNDTATDLELCHITECFQDPTTILGSSQHASGTPFYPVAVASGKKSTKVPMLSVVRGTTAQPEGSRSLTESAFQRSMRYQRQHRHSSGQSKDNETSTTDSEDEYVRSRSPFHFRVTSYPLMQSKATHPLGVFPGLLGMIRDQDDPDDPDDMPQWSDMEPLGLCLLLLSLIRELCHEDCYQLDSKKSVSVLILPALSQLFSSVYYDADRDSDDEVEGYTMTWCDMTMLRRFFVRVVLTVASYVAMQTSGLTVLRGSNALPMLLSVAVDIVCKERIIRPDQRPNTDRLYLAQDIVLGVWLLMEHIFQSLLLNPAVLGAALKLFHDLISHRGLGVYEGLLGLWERLMNHDEEHQQLLTVASRLSEPKEQITFIVSVLSRTIHFLKQAKINYIHSVKCSRQKHKKCDYRWYVHHHHDVLGLAGSKPYMPSSESCDSLEALNGEQEHSDPETCAVAAIGEFLLYLYQKSLSRTMQVKILRCVEEAGVCCCMAPGSIIRVLVKNLPGQSPALRDFTLRILVRIILDQCGGAEQVQRSKGICHICKDETWRGSESDSYRLPYVDNREVMFVARQETSDSAFSGSDMSLHEESHQETTSPRWRVLKQLQSLVLDRQDADVGIQVMLHTLTLVSQGCASLKHELFHCLFMPVLSATKAICGNGQLDCSLTGMNADLARVDSVLPLAVIQYCLVGLPLLLQSRTVHTMFLNYGGMRQLCQLSQVDCLRTSVLRTFQVLIILEERKQEEARGSLEYDLQTRHKWEDGNTDLLDTTQPAQTNLQMERAEEAIEAITLGTPMCSLPHPLGETNATTQHDQNSLSILDEFTQILTDSAKILHKVKSAEYPELNELNKLVDIWNTCDQLFGQSWQFRHKFLGNDGPNLALDLYHTSLDELVKCQDVGGGAQELRGVGCKTAFSVWLALTQSSLNICLAVCRVKAFYAVEELTVKHLMSHMHRVLSTSSIWSPEYATAVGHICDILLASAMIKYSELDLVQLQMFAVMHYKDEDPIYDKELLELNEPSSSKDTETCFTEQGYEADSEFISEEAKGNRSKRKTRELHSPTHSTDHVTYPEVCRLVIELLAAYHERSHDQACSTVVLPHVLLKVLSLVRHNAYTAMDLYNQGILTVLLEGFKSTLTSKHGSDQVEQKLLLDLFLAIAQHALSSYELKTFLELFKSDGISLENLLPTALSLVQSYKAQPSHILCFPIAKTDYTSHYNISVQSLSSDIINASLKPMAPPSDNTPRDSMTFTSTSSQGTENLPFDRTDSPIPEIDNSKLNSKVLNQHAPLQFCLKDQVMWPSPANHKGFSLSLWLRIELSHLSNGSNFDWTLKEASVENKGLWDILGSVSMKRPLPDRLRVAMRRHLDSRHWSNQCLHLVTIGNSTLMFEVWTEPQIANLIFRIVTHINGHQKVLCEVAQMTSIEPSRWQHLTLAFREEAYSHTKRVTVSTILDGCFQRESTMEYSLQSSSTQGNVQDSDCTVWLGHMLPSEDIDVLTGRWQLGNLMLFKDCQMTRHTSFHIYALGPDCCTLSQCDCSEQTVSYAPFITDNIVRHSGLSHDVLTGNHTIYLQHLRENLVMSYSPHIATAFSLYCTPLSSPPAPSSGLKGFLSLSVSKSTFSTLMHQPTPIQAKLLTDVAPQVHQGLTLALDEIGGLSVFIFMFAKVVEMKASACHQAEALRLLFVLIHNNPKFTKEFHNLGGHDLLTKVFESRHCHVGPQIIKVLLDVCLSQPVMLYSQSGQRYYLDGSTTALIRDTHVILNLLLAWKVWERTDPGVWLMVFETLELLVSNDHPFHGFNIQQLQNAGVIEKLLLICLERLQDSYPALPIPICRSLVMIIRQLVGSPPDIHNVMSICDFLLISHPAASTFVCHQEDNFYFRHKWMHQSSSDFVKIKSAQLDQNEAQRKDFTDSNSTSCDLDLDKTGDLEQPEKPNLTSTPNKSKSEDQKVTKSRFGSRQMFRVKEIFTEDKREGMKCQSLPTVGFWSRYEDKATLDTTPEDAEVPINQRLQKGISDAFKSLASSYPQSLNWGRMANIASLVRQPQEIDIKDFKGHREGSELGDLIESDSDEEMSSSGGTGLSKRIIKGGRGLKIHLKKRIKSYSESMTQSQPQAARRRMVGTSSGETEEEIMHTDDDSLSGDASGEDGSSLNSHDDEHQDTQALSIVVTRDPDITVNREENGIHPNVESSNCSYTQFKELIPNGTDSSQSPVPDENDNDNTATCRMSGKSDDSEKDFEHRFSNSDSFVFVEASRDMRDESLRENDRRSSSDWQVYSVERQRSRNVSKISLGGREDEKIEEEEEGLVFICVHLLELLSQIMVNMSQDDFLRLTAAVLKPQILIVMAHHSSPQIRTGVIKVLDVYLLRMTKEHEDYFLKIQGFNLLACQLHEHKVSADIVEACFTILLGQPHKLQDNICASMLVEMRPVQQVAIVPLIALLENSITDTALCHNMLCLMGQVFNSIPNMVLPMLSNGLVEALCNMLSGLCALPPCPTDLGEGESILLIEGVQKFFCCVADKCFSAGDVVCFQHLEDMMTMLYALENKHIELYGVDSEQVSHIKIIQSMCFRAIFDYISELMESQSGLLYRTGFTGAVGSLLSKLPLASANSFSEEDEWTSFDEGLSTANQSSFGWPSFNSSNFLSTPDKKSGETLRSRSLPGTNKENSSLQRKSFTPDLIRRPKVQSSLDLFTTGLFTGRKNQGITQGDLTERFKKIIVNATDFVLFTVNQHARKSKAISHLETIVEVKIEVVSADTEFSRFLLEFLMKGILIGLERSLFQRKTLGMTLMWQAKDVLRIQFSRLLERLLSPDQDITQRLGFLELLANEPKLRDVLKITHNVKLLGTKMALYFYQMQHRFVHQFSAAQREEVQELTDILQSLGVHVYRLGRKLTPNEKASIQEDKSMWNLQYVRERSEWLRVIEDAKNRILQKQDPVVKKLVAQALDITQGVSNTQNVQRKKFMEHVKKQMSNRVQVKKAWQQLIQQLTHERAVWYDERSHPKSWQLDPTEGPSRVRRRLQRCHLGIDAKFLTTDNQEKLKSEEFDPPLAYLFEDDNLASDSAALIYKLHTSQNIQFTCTCMHVTPSTESCGELLIGQNNLYFVADEAIKDADYTHILVDNKDLFISLVQEDIKSIQKRWFQLRDIAVEVFLTSGQTCLLAFTTTKERDELYARLTSLELPNLITDENLSAIQLLWLEGKMTNFEYLTHLNKMAGRSFNDLMQYPVFPFVISNYDELTLDLEADKSFRNLSKPIAVQHKHREQRYIDNYMCLVGEQDRHAVTGIFEYHPEPYHYGSHYSNSGTILHFLVRLPPFTQMFLSYQDDSFDLPDRTFHAMETSWRLASLESSTDVKELIPEFFYLPEFLCNKEGYNFGRRQIGKQVWDVTLPPWCLNDPRLLILAHRQALESEFVTQHLPKWINLVFGHQQKGKAAVDAINVFHPATYFGVDVDSIEDPVRRRAVKTMIKTYGQTPKQLFKVAHPNQQTGSKGIEKQKSLEKELSRLAKKSPLNTVKGLHWGNYVGSPDLLEPTLTWIQGHPSAITSLVALPTGGVFGLGSNSSLLVMYSKEKGATSVNTVDVLWAAIISWGHSDSIIRIKNRKDLPAVNFMHWNTDEQVTCCASVPDCRLLFFGGTSGVISVLNTKFNQNKQSHLQVFGQKQCLYGHSAAITALCVCTAYSVLVSASRDKTVIIWDLNRLSYVRSIMDHQNAVNTVAVSDTLGDIASVSHTDHGSCLMLHTINAQHVSSIECEELILCLAYSTAPEGRSINVIAGGLSSGTIRMWSSWDLKPVRDIYSDKFNHPTISLAFTHDCQRLFAANADGTVAVWEKPSGSRLRDVMFIPFL